MDLDIVKIIGASTVFTVGGIVEYYTSKNKQEWNLTQSTGIGWGTFMAYLILNYSK